MRSSTLFGLAAAVSSVIACDSCYGPANEVVHERLVRRMQPGVADATVGPTSPLEWGQLNFLHTVGHSDGVLIKQADMTRPTLTDGSKDISKSRIMGLIGATSFHFRGTWSQRQAILLSICY
jgi:hypothetical protein